MSNKKTDSEQILAMEDGPILDRIQGPNDIKKLSKEEYPLLAAEIREFLISSISETGGHLASNLGAVELTMALHLSLDLPEDKIIWDVGHQSYTHKLLTGRREGFRTLRKYGGMSGFPKRKESDCDAFDTGHSSTSISAGLGLVEARELKGEDYTVVSVIGDGSLTGGMAFEALNNAAKLRKNFIIILNDNNMSISENVGGLSNYLNSVRTAEKYLDLKEGVYQSLMRSGNEKMVRTLRKAKSTVKQMIVPGMLFEDMGVTYLGPIDGHDVPRLMKAIRYAKRVQSAVMIHVLTQKGKGYSPAEKHPSRFHGAEPFDVATGMPKKVREKANYTDVFATMMCKLAKQKPELVAVSAAMAEGTGLKRFANMYPDRFFDVGIAEEHGVTFAAGLAAGGMHPVVAIYSSFLQRAYDQILHDVCLQGLPVVFAVDRAGLVGSDGETHQGIFDLTYLSSIPGMTVMAPKNKWELADMLEFALEQEGPCAIRYPRGEAYDGLKENREPMAYGKCEVIDKDEEAQICLIGVGSMMKTAEEVCEKLRAEGHCCTLINARFVKPLDPAMAEYARGSKLVVTLEENVITGGFGEQFRELMDAQVPAEVRPKQLCIALPDSYVEHGNVDILKHETEIDAESVYYRILEALN